MPPASTAPFLPVTAADRAMAQTMMDLANEALAHLRELPADAQGELRIEARHTPVPALRIAPLEHGSAHDHALIEARRPRLLDIAAEIKALLQPRAGERNLPALDFVINPHAADGHLRLTYDDRRIPVSRIEILLTLFSGLRGIREVAAEIANEQPDAEMSCWRVTCVAGYSDLTDTTVWAPTAEAAVRLALRVAVSRLAIKEPALMARVSNLSVTTISLLVPDIGAVDAIVSRAMRGRSDPYLAGHTLRLLGGQALDAPTSPR